ncbi:toprim domain-containing protein [Kluyvera cryocrescens]|uniref:Toprim domain-containing protein n=1 Tax=Kluyvera cryocrescens TaxID=580 RepID=A0AAW9C898_KLUCR|nr:toprim domain-containing protein [Kluyvera cryocrescens]MDW3775462.1 toprim domain-containing protein [Kluyvera cryocrescens]MDW3777335.1 toprim domain-containing protein [Kluyvera cryocrescens]
MSHSTSSNLPAKSPMQHAQETFDLVKSHVHQLGGWRNVLSFYPEFHEALEKAPRSVKCPFTGDGKTKFRFKDRSLESVHAIHEDYPHNAFIDGIDLIAELKQVSKTQAAKDILEMIGVSKDRKLNEADRVNIVLYEKKASSFSDIGEEERFNRIKKLEAVYKYTNIATPDSLVARYLSGRGIKRILTKLPASLGLNPKMRYWHGVNKPASFHPTMVAIFNDKLGRNCTIHKTHLSDDGLVKADVENPKLMMKPVYQMNGGSIQLFKPTYDEMSKAWFLGISEGIENALSVTEATSIPCWASSSSTFMEMLKIPDHFMPPSDCDFIELTIWADKDRVNPNTGNAAGETAAQVLKNRMEPLFAARYPHANVHVHIFLPEIDIPDGKKGVDWNDVLILNGTEAFPGKLEEKFFDLIK